MHGLTYTYVHVHVYSVPCPWTFFTSRIQCISLYSFYYCIKPGSQYDACANVASRASRWRWNRLDFYSSIASRALASVQPIRLSKKLTSGMQFDWWKDFFPWRSRRLWRQRHIVNQALCAITWDRCIACMMSWILHASTLYIGWLYQLHKPQKHSVQHLAIAMQQSCLILLYIAWSILHVIIVLPVIVTWINMFNGKAGCSKHIHIEADNRKPFFFSYTMSLPLEHIMTAKRVLASLYTMTTSTPS